MALPGELNGINGVVCEDCGKFLPLSICSSGAGYHLGYTCCMGAISRETIYFRTYELAEEALSVIQPHSAFLRR